MYQAAQNLLLGFGAICGASFGGWICSVISWRFCFIFQTPISLLAIVIAQFPLGPIANKATADGTESRRSQMRDIDFPGAVLLILGLLGQVGSLSLGGNVLRWTDPVVVSVFIGSIIILSAFIWVEKRTSATPIIAVKILRDTRSRALLMSNFFLALVLSGVRTDDAPLSMYTDSYRSSCFSCRCSSRPYFWTLPLKLACGWYFGHSQPRLAVFLQASA